MNTIKKIILPVLLLCVVSTFGQSDPWEVNVDANVTLTMNTYSKSWTGEEKNAFSWSSQLLVLAQKQIAEKFRTENTLKLQFGQTKIEDESIEVSSDLIDFESMEKLTFNTFVDPYVALRLQTTFNDVEPTGNHKVKYINPMIFSESFGVSRNFIQEKDQVLSSRFGGAFYQRVNRMINEVYDGGLELVTKYNVNTEDNFLSYALFLNLYQALYSSDDDNSDKWKAIDVDWQNNFTVNLTKYIMVNYMFQLLYDRNIHEDARFKQVLSVGLTFKYKNNSEG